MARIAVWQWVVLVAVLLTIGINGLANALPLNGVTTGEVSDRFDVYFVPAGYVFGIWGLIYVGLVAYGVYQLLPRHRDDGPLRSIAGPFVLSCVANVAWLLLWHYLLIPWTIVAMLTLLASLIWVYTRLGVGDVPVSLERRLAVHLPFSIYLGWITVATIANATTVLENAGWGGWGLGEADWATIMLGVAVVLAAAMTLRRRDVAFDLVLVWAFVGIAVRFPGVTQVAVSAWAAAALSAVLAVVALWLSRRTAPVA